jgi:ABC-type nitrate/sulfonate/bicarbonate transport system ATPase subunit
VLSDSIALLEAHPGRLVEVVNNTLARPRDRTAHGVVSLEKDIYGRRYAGRSAAARA